LFLFFLHEYFAKQVGGAQRMSFLQSLSVSFERKRAGVGEREKKKRNEEGWSENVKHQRFGSVPSAFILSSSKVRGRRKQEGEGKKKKMRAYLHCEGFGAVDKSDAKQRSNQEKKTRGKKRDRKREDMVCCAIKVFN
jgi:hypothetical protein